MTNGTSNLTLSNFTDWLEGYGTDPEWAKAYVKDIYLTDPGGCLPGKYIGDEILYSIREKFWYPFRWILERAVHAAEVRVDERDLRDRVLYHDSWKAWHFWWPAAARFEAWANEVFAEILKKLNLVPM